jgi:hypothetical protein
MSKLLSTLLILTLAWTASAASTRNDDSCDIALLPAATLLLPYFEVDLDDPEGSTTLFTVTNVTHVDQIAYVTFWTDYGFPVLTFNIYLTGYDVQSINLYDVIVRGVFAPDFGTGTAIADRGDYSDPNQSIDLSLCDRLPGPFDPAYVERLQEAFTEGRVSALGNLPACNFVGGVHQNAIGYATIDVVRKCTVTLPTEPEYWTNEIGYANALSGDYQHVRRGDRFADGGPLVHIRAVPEGGASPPSFPRTFYSRYQSPATPKLDARQPLPAVFATRWIDGGPASYQTFMKVWREPKTGANATCAQYAANEMALVEIVNFDEAENAVTDLPDNRFPPFEQQPITLPSTSMTSVADTSFYPAIGNGSLGGWVYFNLDEPNDEIASQAWVISSMRAEGQFSVDTHALSFGNGCSARVGNSEVGVGTTTIAPLPNERIP